MEGVRIGTFVVWCFWFRIFPKFMLRKGSPSPSLSKIRKHTSEWKEDTLPNLGSIFVHLTPSDHAFGHNSNLEYARERSEKLKDTGNREKVLEYRITLLSSILMASLYASTASSYFPSFKNALPFSFSSRDLTCEYEAKWIRRTLSPVSPVAAELLSRSAALCDSISSNR